MLTVPIYQMPSTIISSCSWTPPSPGGLIKKLIQHQQQQQIVHMTGDNNSTLILG